MKYLFDNQILDTDRRELKRGSRPVAVEPQVFDLLVHLVENRDRVVSKDDLIASVWGGRIVSDSTLTTRINAARRAVGDSGEKQKLIRTIARKGLRFVGAVHIQPEGIEPAPSAVRTGEGLREPTRSVPTPPDRPAIAVLPFTNMTGDPGQEYFSDGISEDIITALSKLRWFFVIARNSSFIYKGKAVHLKQVAEELGVGYVVEGSVRRAGDRVRITVQLNDVGTGSHIWAERYDRSLADVFALQDEITEFDRRRNRAAALCRRKFPRQAQAARQHGCLGSGDASAVALLAGDAPGQRRGAGAARKGDRHRSQLWAGAEPLGGKPHVQRAYGLGGHGGGDADRRARRDGGAARRQRGPMGAPGARLGLSVRAAISTIRWPSSSQHSVSIRTSRLPKANMA